MLPITGMNIELLGYISAFLIVVLVPVGVNLTSQFCIQIPGHEFKAYYVELVLQDAAMVQSLSRGGIFGQCTGSVPTQHREEVAYLRVAAAIKSRKIKII